jgi:CARDB
MANRRTSYNRKSTRPSNMLEALESRTLLSAAVAHAQVALPESLSLVSPAIVISTDYDLSATLKGAPKLLTSILTGVSIKGSVSVIVTNNGTAATPKLPVSIVAYLRPAGGDGSTDISIMPKPGSVSALAAGKPKGVNLSLTIPPTLAAGTYTLVVKTDATGALTETDETNNTLVTGTTVSAAQAFIGLGNAITSSLPALLDDAADVNGVAQVTVTNNGNIPVPSTGLVDVTVSLRPTGGADIVIGSSTAQKFSNVKIGAPVQFAVSVTVPLGTTAGNYTLVATVTPSGFTATVNAPAVGAAVTVTGTTASPGTVWQHGDVITFHAVHTLNSPVFIESGTFITNQGIAGTYQLTSADILLQYNGLPGEDYLIDFTNKPISFNKKRVTFSFNSNGAAIATMPHRGTHAAHTAYVRFS